MIHVLAKHENNFKKYPKMIHKGRDRVTVWPIHGIPYNIYAQHHVENYRPTKETDKNKKQEKSRRV